MVTHGLVSVYSYLVILSLLLFEQPQLVQPVTAVSLVGLVMIVLVFLVLQGCVKPHAHLLIKEPRVLSLQIIIIVQNRFLSVSFSSCAKYIFILLGFVFS